MGRSRYKMYDTNYPHFITLTVTRWIPLLSNPEIASICLKSLQYLQQNENLELFGWVFMENHIHLVARSPKLSKVIGRMKSYTARMIVDYYKACGATHLLDELAWGKSFHKQSQDFQVWQEGSHPEQIFSREMMEKKITYIHNNPLKRGFVDKIEHWRYSSARNYQGVEGLLDVVTSWY